MSPGAEFEVLLEDPAMSERVQVLALVDEEVLSAAVRDLLEDPAMSERVQVLALVDEEVLSAAVRDKFNLLIEHRGGDAATTIREHMEKLFLCALRLPPFESRTSRSYS
jgi:hypothetical protein